jgi:hypothetical protein
MITLAHMPAAVRAVSFPVRNCRFAVENSLFAIKTSQFPTPISPFPVEISRFSSLRTVSRRKHARNDLRHSGFLCETPISQCRIEEIIGCGLIGISNTLRRRRKMGFTMRKRPERIEKRETPR